jgi:hypothetical protein
LPDRRKIVANCRGSAAPFIFAQTAEALRAIKSAARTIDARSRSNVG